MTIKHKGFTLTELLIVVSIIVILGMAILLAINPMSQLFKGYDARRKSDLSQIKIAMEAYYSDHDCYPPKSVFSQCGSDALKPYLNSIPCDPNTKKPYNILLLPNTACPQQFAVYAQIYAFFDNQANDIDYCPNTIAVSSSGMSSANISYGCSSEIICPIYYGCVNGACVIISEDRRPSCSPHNCLSTCGAFTNESTGEVTDCTTVNPDTGKFSLECEEI